MRTSWLVRLSPSSLPSPQRSHRRWLALVALMAGLLSLLHAAPARADTFSDVHLGAHRMISGHVGRTVHRLDAGQFLITTARPNGRPEVARGYCVDFAHRLDRSATYIPVGPTSDAIAQILTAAPAEPSDDEAAAVQAALWHLSDGFILDGISSAAAIVHEYQRLLAAADGSHSTVATLSFAPMPPTTIDTPVPVAVWAQDRQGRPVNGVAVHLEVTGPAAIAPGDRTTITAVTHDGRAVAEVIPHGETTTLRATAMAPSGMELAAQGHPGQRLVLASPTMVEARASLAAVRSTPTLSTTPTPGGPPGTLLADHAQLGGTTAPTGVLTFALYGPQDVVCTGIPVATWSVAVAAGGEATSPSFAAGVPGTYRWTVAYGGDRAYAPVTSPCGSELASVTVAQVSATASSPPPPLPSVPAAAPPAPTPVPKTGVAVDWLGLTLLVIGLALTRGRQWFGQGG